MIKTVFKIIGFELKTPEGNFMESCAFWIYAKTEKEAIEIAKSKGVKKTNWTTLEVIEKDCNDRT